MPLDDDPRVRQDSTDALLTATGRGDLGAFAEFYDRTAPTVFGLVRDGRTPSAGNTRAAERATERVYLIMWRTAPRFEADARSAYSTLLSVTRQVITGARPVSCRCRRSSCPACGSRPPRERPAVG